MHSLGFHCQLAYLRMWCTKMPWPQITDKIISETRYLTRNPCQLLLHSTKSTLLWKHNQTKTHLKIHGLSGPDTHIKGILNAPELLVNVYISGISVFLKAMISSLWRCTSWAMLLDWNIPMTPQPLWPPSTSTWTQRASSYRMTICKAFRRSMVSYLWHMVILYFCQFIHRMMGNYRTSWGDTSLWTLVDCRSNFFLLTVMKACVQKYKFCSPIC